LARLLIRHPKEKRGAYILLFLVGFVGFSTLSRLYVLPVIHTWEARRQAVKVIEDSRLFTLLASKHPEVREQFIQMLVGLARQGSTSAEAAMAGYTWGRQFIEPYFQRYVPYASDVSLVNFVSSLVAMLEQLKARQDDTCFLWMFGGNTSESSQLAHAMRTVDQQPLLDTMAHVIESAITAPQPALDQYRVATLLVTYTETLVEKYGTQFLEDLAMLGTPRAARVKRQAVCATALTFYRDALQRPQGEREVLLRSLFTAKAG
jgi:hypothetical protein